MAENVDAPKKEGRSGWRFVLIASLVAAVAAVGGAALLVNIMERKQEGKNPFYRVVDLDDVAVVAQLRVAAVLTVLVEMPSVRVASHRIPPE